LRHRSRPGRKTHSRWELQEFNCYHHGGKVNLQDRQHLRDCIAYGEAKGKKMAALKTLLQRTEEREAVPA
jgi:hypothetical protein